jgi:hypothetical protein
LNLILDSLKEAGSKCFNKSKVFSDKEKEVFLIQKRKQKN